MKNTFLTLVFLFVLSVSSFAQADYMINSAMDFFRAQQITSGEFKNTLTEKDIKGSPFLNDDFLTGSIYTTSKVQFVDIPLRYNIYNDDLEFKSPDDKVMAMSTPEIVERAVFGEYTMSYIPFVSVKKIRRGFFVILEQGDNCTLYSRPTVLYEKPQEPGAYKEAEPAKFIKRPDTYYLRFGKDAAKKVGNKKELISIFPDHTSEIQAFIKKNKIKTNKPEGLKKLVQYYNSL